MGDTDSAGRDHTVSAKTTNWQLHKTDVIIGLDNPQTDELIFIPVQHQTVH